MRYRLCYITIVVFCDRLNVPTDDHWINRSLKTPKSVFFLCNIRIKGRSLAPFFFFFFFSFFLCRLLQPATTELTTIPKKVIDRAVRQARQRLSRRKLLTFLLTYLLLFFSVSFLLKNYRSPLDSLFVFFLSVPLFACCQLVPFFPQGFRPSALLPILKTRKKKKEIVKTARKKHI